MSHALHYGTSVFEGVRCYDSHKGPVVFRHREHMQRLRDSAKIYRMPVSQSVDELMEACRETLRTNKLVSAYIRPLVFIGDVGMGVNPPDGYKTDVIIAAFPWGAYLGEEALEQGIDAMVSSWNRVAANTIPTAAKAGGNYLSSLLVGSEARRHGYQEGIALDVTVMFPKARVKTCLKLKTALSSRRHSPLLHCRVSPATPSSNWRKTWVWKCVNKCCLANLCIWLTKSSCQAPRLKSPRFAALMVSKWVSANVVQ